MLHAVDSHRVLASFVKAVRPVSATVRLHVSEAGIAVRAVGTGASALVDAALPATRFESYVCTESAICLDLDGFAEILEVFAKDPVTVSYTESSGVLRVAGGVYEFTIPVLDPRAVRADPNRPALAYPATVVIPGPALAAAVRVVQSVAERVVFAARPLPAPAFEVASPRDSARRATATHLDGQAGVAVAAPDAVESTFTAKAVADLIREIAASPAVRVDLGADMPVTFAGLAGEAVPVTYVLAPRIGT